MSNTRENAQNSVLDAFAFKVAELRSENFDESEIIDGKQVLVKVHRVGEVDDNPIDPKEAEVQSLRYLRGMYLIFENTPCAEKEKINWMSEWVSMRNRYIERTAGRAHTADDTLWLTNECAKLLVQRSSISMDKALKQLTMARDLGILLEDHPIVKTVTETENTVTTEMSIPYKVSKEYYEKYFPATGVSDESWMASARKLAGMSDDKNNWLDHFFNDPNNRDNIIAKGVSAPPSARWLPIPANMQKVTIDVQRRQPDRSLAYSSHSQFLRTGIIIPYDIRYVSDKKPYRYQKQIAKDIMKEIVRSQLEMAIKEFRGIYKELYPDNARADFYVNYQTLLSPLIGERRFGHVDNNARFVRMAKKVMAELVSEGTINDIALKNNVDLKLVQTNSAVNRNARYTVSYSTDKAARQEKIDSLLTCLNKFMIHPIENVMDVTVDMIRRIDCNEIAKNDLVLRLQAAQALQALLNKEQPYRSMKAYQRNITIGALELLVTGAQALHLDGCKSARDRTAVFANAVKVTKENPEAMRNWKVLEDGIKSGLNKGHHFRSMISHCAVVKAALVHIDFMKGFTASVQKGIKELLIFSRKPPKYQDAAAAKKNPMARFFDKSSSSMSGSKRSDANEDVVIGPLKPGK